MVRVQASIVAKELVESAYPKARFIRILPTMLDVGLGTELRVDCASALTTDPHVLFAVRVWWLKPSFLVRAWIWWRMRLRHRVVYWMRSIVWTT
jgi:hypothetical protein